MCQILAASPDLLLDIFLSPGWDGKRQEFAYRHAFREAFLRLLKAKKISLAVPENIISWLHFAMHSERDVTEVSKAIDSIIKYSYPSNNIQRSNSVIQYPDPSIELCDILSITAAIDAPIEMFLVNPWELKNYKNLIKENNQLLSKVSFEIIDINQFPLEDFSLQDVDMQENISVYTPKGELFSLKHGSMPLDFAYKVHTTIGDSFAHVEINGASATLSQQLKEGDVVHIITSDEVVPKTDWLFYASNRKTRDKIKNSIRKRYRREGWSIVEEALGSNRESYFKKLEEFCQQLGYSSVGEFVRYLGDGTITVEDFYKHLSAYRFFTRPDLSIHREDATNIKFQFASQCFPVPGTACNSQFSKSKKSYIIHHCSCPRLHEHLGSEDSIEPNWDWGESEWGTKIKIVLKNVPGVLYSVLKSVDKSGFKHDLQSLSVYSGNSMAVTILTLYSKPESGEKLRQTLASLSQLDRVQHVRIKDIFPIKEK